MIWPSLYHLQRDGLLPAGMKLVGCVRQPMADDEFRTAVSATLSQQLAPEQLQPAALTAFLQRVSSVAASVGDDGKLHTTALVKVLSGRAVLFFLATPPDLFGPICSSLGAAGLATAESRVIVEKPIGHDLASSREVNAAIAQYFREDQVFRIDHYLGKETVQNLLALRFGNSMFEPLWTSGSINNVQITIAETVGVEGRWSYYDQAGALRDMMQNHLLQLVALVAMEPPSNLDAAAVRNEKTKVLRSLRPIEVADVESSTVRGQYAAGTFEGKPALGYNEEAGARAGSDTETFVALRARIDNWRWAGVPFYLRTGKRLQSRRTEIVIQFKHVPHNIFSEHQPILPANRLVIRLQPQERVTMELLSKEPGLEGVRLKTVPLELSLTEAFAGTRSRIAYERLLLDAIKGKTTLFVRGDEIEAAWTWIDSIHDSWKRTRQPTRPYAAGSWGPTSAIALAERHGHSWYE
jgi:glucose-6-phosphate 1-dehydrogenase